MQKLNNKPSLKEIRKQLRNNATPAEATLWKHLSNSKLAGKKFRRQHSIGNYIADFYCPSEKLVIELDGSVHNNIVAIQKDFERTEHLNDLGIRVIRFENKEVFQNIDLVLEKIKQVLEPYSPPF